MEEAVTGAEIIQARLDKLIAVIADRPEILENQTYEHHTLVSPLSARVKAEFADHPDLRLATGFNYTRVFVGNHEIAHTAIPMSIKIKLDEMDAKRSS